MVKTAFSASDANLGRILAAIGYAHANVNIDALNVYLGDVLVAEHGGRAASYTDEQGARVMQQAEITVRVDLRMGTQRIVVYTCDLTHEYVSINADYRS